MLMAAVVAWCRVAFVAPTGVETAPWVIVGPGAPDLATVEALARSQLWARRLGGSVRLLEVRRELYELLDFVGLRREVGGEAEAGEEVLGVEEGVEPGDPLA